MRTFLVKRLGLIFVKNKNYLSVRLFSKANGSDSVRRKNPFQKKKVKTYKEESDSRNAGRICITILGNGGFGQPRCVGLFTEFKSYLFNCGEGVGRYCREYEISTQHIKHVFITQRKWENLCGLSDIYTTNKSLGLYEMSLYGPAGIESILSMLSSKEMDTKLKKKEGGYIDHTVHIDCIPISCEKKVHSSFNYGKKKHFYREEPDVYCYACKIHHKPGDFLPEKCVEYGVPIGPEVLKLKNWENIVLPSGKTIYAEDIHSVSYPERKILIVDCPSESFLESFINEKKFQEYQTNSSPEVLVFHFTPVHIFNSKQYQEWIHRFQKDTEHFFLNSDNSTVGSKVAHQTNKYFNLLHPEIFSELRDKELIHKQNNFTGGKMIYPPPMMMIHLRPTKEFNMSNVVSDGDNLNIAIDGTDIVMHSSEFYEKLNNLKSSFLDKSVSAVDENTYPEIVFLGTSSATSTAYRNVSSILLNTSSDNSILLDCGDGTLLQFVRYFGSDVFSALRKISCIFITHKHLDHYMGLFNLISKRIKAFEQADIQYEPLAVILPFEIEHIFKIFCEVFDDIKPAVKLFSCRYLHYQQKKREGLRRFIGNIELCTVPVQHCTDAWGVVLELESQWKIVYSGDTRPCQALIDAGKDCTLLIHEASVEDGLYLDAMAKKHSTPSEVIDVAEKMAAQHLILTHFSKRYLGFPILPESCPKEIACAFDFMKVRMHDLPLLPLFTPVIKCLFEGQLQAQAEKSACGVNFEKPFMKVLKSEM